MSTGVVLSMGAVPTTELVQAGLQDGGRLLLTVAMTLFLSYVLFMLGAVVLSAVADRVRSLRARFRTAELADYRSVPERSAELQRMSA